jgi:hypothetical protein
MGTIELYTNKMYSTQQKNYRLQIPLRCISKIKKHSLIATKIWMQPNIALKWKCNQPIRHCEIGVYAAWVIVPAKCLMP